MTKAQELAVAYKACRDAGMSDEAIWTAIEKQAAQMAARELIKEAVRKRCGKRLASIELRLKRLALSAAEAP